MFVWLWGLWCFFFFSFGNANHAGYSGMLQHFSFFGEGHSQCWRPGRASWDWKSAHINRVEWTHTQRDVPHNHSDGDGDGNAELSKTTGDWELFKWVWGFSVVCTVFSCTITLQGFVGRWRFSRLRWTIGICFPSPYEILGSLESKYSVKLRGSWDIKEDKVEFPVPDSFWKFSLDIVPWQLFDVQDSKVERRWAGWVCSDHFLRNLWMLMRVTDSKSITRVSDSINIGVFNTLLSSGNLFIVFTVKGEVDEFK